ncbi:MAG: type II secretion system protein [Verrucomicrobia bacterium]|nr:type II secretion system protein [Verrucomicrobiota bacterium]
MRTQPDREASARTSGAFTLIELLVVMAIIAVLIGLLFPTIGAIKESANVSVCTSNLQQIYRCLNAYTTDNQGRLPWNETGGPAGSWIAGYAATGTNGVLGITRGSLYKYLKDIRVYRCPSYPDRDYIRSYSMADYMSGKTPPPTISFQGFSAPCAGNMGAVDRPAQTLMLIEENPPGFPPADGRTYLNDGFYGGSTGRDRPATYHRPNKKDPTKGKANACFVDGHVQLLSNDEADRAYEMFYHVPLVNR